MWVKEHLKQQKQKIQFSVIVIYDTLSQQQASSRRRRRKKGGKSAAVSGKVSLRFWIIKEQECAVGKL